MPKQQAVAGGSNINRRRTSPPRRRPRLMRKNITPLSRVCRTNRWPLARRTLKEPVLTTNCPRAALDW